MYQHVSDMLIKILGLVGGTVLHWEISRTMMLVCTTLIQSDNTDIVCGWLSFL